MPVLKEQTALDLAPGLTGYYAHGDQMTLGIVEIAAGSQLPQHSHEQEQITYIVEGQLDMVIDGKACPLQAGMFYVIPSHVPHGATAVTDCKVIDVFHPVRTDYRERTH